MPTLQRPVWPIHLRLPPDTFASAICSVGATPSSRKPLADQLYVYRPEGGSPTKSLSLYGLHQLSRQYQHVGHAVACRAAQWGLGVMHEIVPRGRLVARVIVS